MEMRPVPGYEGHYSVTADGRIWSEPRRAPQLRRGKGSYPVLGRWLTTKVGRQGYPTVMLTLYALKKRVYIHRVLAQAFIPIPLGCDRLEVNHINGIKTDNRLENLEWLTPAQNSKHAYTVGLREPTRKLTDEQVIVIRRRVAAGESQRRVSLDYGISSSNISRLCAGKSYMACLPISNRRGETARECNQYEPIKEHREN